MDKSYISSYRQAVKEVIQETHARGFPAYQCIDGYIVALYPNGKTVKLQKAKPVFAYASFFK